MGGLEILESEGHFSEIEACEVTLLVEVVAWVTGFSGVVVTTRTWSLGETTIVIGPLLPLLSGGEISNGPALKTTLYPPRAIATVNNTIAILFHQFGLSLLSLVFNVHLPY